MNFYEGIREEQSDELKERVIKHRNTFFHIFYNRYRELLSSLIVYKNEEEIDINFLKLETALRHNYNVVVGKNAYDKIVILGWSNSIMNESDPNLILGNNRLTKKDVNFIVSPDQIPEYLEEISYRDGCTTGNMVVLRNKTLNYVSDMLILEHYAKELAEIVLSRFSISMQAKINTFFISQANSESINQLITDLYNGAPFVKVTELFDPKENIHTLENEHLASNFVELKREYQNKISELNNMLGINSLAVEKSSGVSDTEAKSNRGFTTSNANIYLEARNEPLTRLNRRFGLDIKAIYNDEVLSEINQMENQKEGTENEGMVDGGNDGNQQEG